MRHSRLYDESSIKQKHTESNTTDSFYISKNIEMESIHKPNTYQQDQMLELYKKNIGKPISVLEFRKIGVLCHTARNTELRGKGHIIDNYRKSKKKPSGRRVTISSYIYRGMQFTKLPVGEIPNNL